MRSRRCRENGSVARAECTAAGWTRTDPGRATGFMFAERTGERLQVSVEGFDPTPEPGHQDTARLRNRAAGVALSDWAKLDMLCDTVRSIAHRGGSACG